MQYFISVPRAFLCFALCLLIASPLVGCGSGSSSDSGDEADASTSISNVISTSDFGRISLSWEGGASADVIYSADPDCDWDNYSLCNDSDLLVGQESGFVLDGTQVTPGVGYYFVAESGGERSEVVAATAWTPGLEDNAIDMAVHEDVLYVGGSFGYAMPGTLHGMILEPEVSRLYGVLQNVNDDILAVVADGRGGWFIGGDFTEVAGQERHHLARIQPTGALDPDWAPRVDARVRALVMGGDRLFVGGDFEEAGDASQMRTREHITAFEAESGELVASWSSNATDHRVRALAYAEGALYAGGDFDHADNEASEFVAAFDADNGALLSTWQNPEINADDVLALVVHGDHLIIGGEISSVGPDETQRENLAALDRHTGEVVHWVSNAVDGQVNALVLHEGVLYVGGDFGEASGHPRNRIAALDPDTGFVLDTFTPEVDREVFSLMVSDGTLYVGGEFREIDGEPRESLAAFDLPSGALLDWNPGADNSVRALAMSEGRLYAGGEFEAGGGVPRAHLAAFDALTGELLPWSPVLDDLVRTLKVSGDVLYVGGDFEHVQAQERDHLAAFDLADGSLLDWAPDPSFTDSVRALAANEDTVFAGGFRDHPGTLTRLSAFQAPHLGDEKRWEQDIRNTSFPQVNALALDGDSLYVGGSFSKSLGTVRDFLFELTLNSVDPDENPDFNAGWDPAVDSHVRALAVEDGIIYVGGRLIGADTWTGLGAYDQDGDPTAWQHQPSSQSTIFSFLIESDRFYVGGSFSSIDGETRERLAAIETDGTLSPGWAPIVNGSVSALARSGDVVFAGGQFEQAGGQPRARLTAFDASSGELVW